MITISLCMIVKNEEDNLARCLNSVKDAVDEIIIMDTGSTDGTVTIAEQYTSKVFHFDWIDDFSAARNAAYDQAGMEYQLWLDADDVILPEQLEKLLALKASLSPDVDMVTMKYDTHFDEQGNPILTSVRERLTRTAKNYRWQDPIHECIPLGGNLVHSDIIITHRKEKTEGHSRRNIGIYEGLEKKRHKFTPRQLYYFARELRDHREYAKAIYYFERFLDGGAGWVEDNIAACHALSQCKEALGQSKEALGALHRGLTYSGPRAEICSEIGYWYKRRGQYALAIEWFRTAANLDLPETLGFLLRDYWGFIPNIEMCVCFHKLGDLEKARYYNEKAAEYKPDHPMVAHNREFFGSLG